MENIEKLVDDRVNELMGYSKEELGVLFDLEDNQDIEEDELILIVRDEMDL